MYHEPFLLIAGFESFSTRYLSFLLKFINNPVFIL